jgi:hypothetical protein
MTYLLAPVGSATTRHEGVDGVIDWHLHPDHAGVWTSSPHARICRGMRLVAKVSGAKIIGLTGTVIGTEPERRPITLDDGRQLDWCYAVGWDPKPSRPTPAIELGAPYADRLQSMRFIDRDTFLVAYRALHGGDPPRQDLPRNT